MTSTMQDFLYNLKC